MLFCKTNRSGTEHIDSDSRSRDVCVDHSRQINVKAIQTHNTSLKLVMTQKLRKNMNVVPLSDFHSLDVKVLNGGAH